MAIARSLLVPVQKLVFLGLVINTIDMIFVLPDDKVKSYHISVQDFAWPTASLTVSVRDLSQLIGKLTGSFQAVFPEPLHYRWLQHLKHHGLPKGSGYDSCLRERKSVEASPPRSMER